MSTIQLLTTLSLGLAFAYLAAVGATAIVAALRSGGRLEERAEDLETLSASRFTIPVTVVVPVSTAAPGLSKTISSILGLNYPEIEVIVVLDGPSQAAIDSLVHDWHLEAKEFFYRRTLHTEDVRRIFRSDRDVRLIVIDKTRGGHGDALNCGVNVARYRYFVSVPPEAVFERDALLRVMSAALRDPARVIGASNHVEHGVVVADSSAPARGFPVFQRLASVRSIMDSRLTWRRLGAGLGAEDGVLVWRRDVVVRLNGFSRTAADANLDMMFRAQASGSGGAGRFDRGADVFGGLAAQSMRTVITSTARRQVAALKILSSWMREGRGSLDPRSLAYFLASELVTPFAQIWIVFVMLVGASLGWFPWTMVALAVVALSFGNAAVTGAALLLRGAIAEAPGESALRRLLLAGPLEFVVYQPALAAARIAGVVSFLKITLVDRTP